MFLLNYIRERNISIQKTLNEHHNRYLSLKMFMKENSENNVFLETVNCAISPIDKIQKCCDIYNSAGPEHSLNNDFREAVLRISSTCQEEIYFYLQNSNYLVNFCLQITPEKETFSYTIYYTHRNRHIIDEKVIQQLLTEKEKSITIDQLMVRIKRDILIYEEEQLKKLLRGV